MKGRTGSLVLLLLLAAVALSACALKDDERDGGRSSGDSPGPGPATVLRAVDGDTLEMRLDSGEVEDVRLIGVDTPETVKPDSPVECFGPAASAFEHRVAEGRRARLVPGVEPRDVYGRLLAYVWLEQSNERPVSDNPKRGAHRERFLNAELLQRGLARTLTIPPNDRFAERFAAIEDRAADAGRGLWGHC